MAKRIDDGPMMKRMYLRIHCPIDQLQRLVATEFDANSAYHYDALIAIAEYVVRDYGPIVSRQG